MLYGYSRFLPSDPSLGSQLVTQRFLKNDKIESVWELEGLVALQFNRWRFQLVRLRFSLFLPHLQISLLSRGLEYIIISTKAHHKYTNSNLTHRAQRSVKPGRN